MREGTFGGGLAALGDKREHDPHEKNDAESDSQSCHAALKFPLPVGPAFEPFEEGDPGGDAAVPPRSTSRVEPVAACDVGEGVGEDPDPDPAANKLMVRTPTGYVPIGGSKGEDGNGMAGASATTTSSETTRGE